MTRSKTQNDSKYRKEIHAIPDSENTREVAVPAGREPVRREGVPWAVW